MNIWKATLDDTELLLKLRIDYLLDDGKSPTPSEVELIKNKFREYLYKWLVNDGFFAFVAEKNNAPCSTAFLSIVERPPRNAAASYLVGTVYNVYTYPQHRRKGIATMVMTALLHEAKMLNVASIDLLATDAGKPLYKKLGFQEINDYTSMRLKL